MKHDSLRQRPFGPLALRCAIAVGVLAGLELAKVSRPATTTVVQGTS